MFFRRWEHDDAALTGGSGEPTGLVRWLLAVAIVVTIVSIGLPLIGVRVSSRRTVSRISHRGGTPPPWHGGARTVLILSKSTPRLSANRTPPRLCAAIVDRLTFGGTIIETDTDSYHLAQTRAACRP